MAKRGRKSAYDTRIKPRFSDILEWLQNGATEKQICDNLAISKDAFYKYKREKSEFNELIEKGRESLVIKLRGALVKKAFGFEYTESKTVISKDADGKTSERTEIYKRRALPDVAALNLCLKNYDADNWANDPQANALKREELELKKKMYEDGQW